MTRWPGRTWRRIVTISTGITRWPGRMWRRIVSLYNDRLAQSIPPLGEIEDALDKRIAAGENEEDAAAAVVEDFERSGVAATARTAPLVPASGIVVTGAGILTQQSEAVAYVAFLAMGLALVGLAFLGTSLFTHVGQLRVGVPPTREDIAFARERLVKKEGNARTGSLFTTLGFLVVVIIIASM